MSAMMGTYDRRQLKVPLNGGHGSPPKSSKVSRWNPRMFGMTTRFLSSWMRATTGVLQTEKVPRQTPHTSVKDIEILRPTAVAWEPFLKGRLVVYNGVAVVRFLCVDTYSGFRVARRTAHGNTMRVTLLFTSYCTANRGLFRRGCPETKWYRTWPPAHLCTNNNDMMMLGCSVHAQTNACLCSWTNKCMPILLLHLFMNNQMHANTTTASVHKQPS